jgi:hypothetical protein
MPHPSRIQYFQFLPPLRISHSNWLAPNGEDGAKWQVGFCRLQFPTSNGNRTLPAPHPIQRVRRTDLRRLPAVVLTLAHAVARFPPSIPQIGGKVSLVKSGWCVLSGFGKAAVFASLLLSIPPPDKLGLVHRGGALRDLLQMKVNASATGFRADNSGDGT